MVNSRLRETERPRDVKTPGRKITRKREFESYHKRFQDFEIRKKFSENHVFRRTILYPLQIAQTAPQNYLEGVGENFSPFEVNKCQKGPLGLRALLNYLSPTAGEISLRFNLRFCPKIRESFKWIVLEFSR